MKQNGKVLGVFALVMMNLVIVANLQIVTATAIYGSTLLFYYAIAAIAFFIPCCLITAELVTHWPVNGGAYIWVEQAFGRSAGFFAACIQWLCNLIWYPTIFSLIATGVAYLINPSLAQDNWYILISITVLFWTITLLNCFGIRISSLASTIGALVGILLPAIIIAILAVVWVSSGKSSEIDWSANALLPSLQNSNNLAFLIEVVISMVGIEMAAVHASNVKNPVSTYPKAIFISAALAILVLLGAALGIATVLPSQQIALVSGVLDAFDAFFKIYGLFAWTPWVILLITIGNLGSVAAWMISSTRGMQVASTRCALPAFMQKINRFDAPVGILILEAIIFTIVSTVFILMPSVNNAFWTLLDMASQITLIYYILLFISAWRLRYKANSTVMAYQIPGKKWGIAIAVILASFSSLMAIGFGFLTPDSIPSGTATSFHLILIIGMLSTCTIPFILLRTAKMKSLPMSNPLE